MEVADREKFFDTRFFLVLYYYFNLVSLVKKSALHLSVLVDQFSLPSMPKREIVEI